MSVPDLLNQIWKKNKKIGAPKTGSSSASATCANPKQENLLEIFLRSGNPLFKLLPERGWKFAALSVLIL